MMGFKEVEFKEVEYKQLFSIGNNSYIKRDGRFSVNIVTGNVLEFGGSELIKLYTSSDLIECELEKDI